MSAHPETRYVSVGDADVAYQVLSDGPVDLLFCYGLGSHIEFNRQIASVAAFYDRLAAFSRVVTFDRRGVGASDGVPRNAVPTWEEWAEDVGAVIDATQSQTAGAVRGDRQRADGDAVRSDAPRPSERARVAQHQCAVP